MTSSIHHHGYQPGSVEVSLKFSSLSDQARFHLDLDLSRSWGMFAAAAGHDREEQDFNSDQDYQSPKFWERSRVQAP